MRHWTAFLLIPCLLVDPSWAQSVAPRNLDRSSGSSNIALFEGQALSAESYGSQRANYLYPHLRTGVILMLALGLFSQASPAQSLLEPATWGKDPVLILAQGLVAFCTLLLVGSYVYERSTQPAPASHDVEWMIQRPLSLPLNPNQQKRIAQEIATEVGPLAKESIQKKPRTFSRERRIASLTGLRKENALPPSGFTTSLLEYLGKQLKEPGVQFHFLMGSSMLSDVVKVETSSIGARRVVKMRLHASLDWKAWRPWRAWWPNSKVDVYLQLRDRSSLVGTSSLSIWLARSLFKKESFEDESEFYEAAANRVAWWFEPVLTLLVLPAILVAVTAGLWQFELGYIHRSLIALVSWLAFGAIHWNGAVKQNDDGGYRPSYAFQTFRGAGPRLKGIGTLLLSGLASMAGFYAALMVMPVITTSTALMAGMMGLGFVGAMVAHLRDNRAPFDPVWRRTVAALFGVFFVIFSGFYYYTFQRNMEWEKSKSAGDMALIELASERADVQGLEAIAQDARGRHERMVARLAEARRLHASTVDDADHDSLPEAERKAIFDLLAAARADLNKNRFSKNPKSRLGLTEPGQWRQELNDLEADAVSSGSEGLLALKLRALAAEMKHEGDSVSGIEETIKRYSEVKASLARSMTAILGVMEDDLDLFLQNELNPETALLSQKTTLMRGRVAERLYDSNDAFKNHRDHRDRLASLLRAKLSPAVDTAHQIDSDISRMMSNLAEEADLRAKADDHRHDKYKSTEDYIDSDGKPKTRSVTKCCEDNSLPYTLAADAAEASARNNARNAQAGLKKLNMQLEALRQDSTLQAEHLLARIPKPQVEASQASLSRLQFAPSLKTIEDLGREVGSRLQGETNYVETAISQDIDRQVAAAQTSFAVVPLASLLSPANQVAVAQALLSVPQTSSDAAVLLSQWMTAPGVTFRQIDRIQAAASLLGNPQREKEAQTFLAGVMSNEKEFTLASRIRAASLLLSTPAQRAAATGFLITLMKGVAEDQLIPLTGVTQVDRYAAAAALIRVSPYQNEAATLLQPVMRFSDYAMETRLEAAIALLDHPPSQNEAQAFLLRVERGQEPDMTVADRVKAAMAIASPRKGPSLAEADALLGQALRGKLPGLRTEDQIAAATALLPDAEYHYEALTFLKGFTPPEKPAAQQSTPKNALLLLAA